MTRRQIDRFFRVLAAQLARPARVILTGAAAGAVWGSVRPSLDIDFAITPAAGRGPWERIEAAIAHTVTLTGIPANFAEDIDRWSQISLLDYRRRTVPYKRFGRLEVRLLHPAYWSIGKVARYLDPDVRDLVSVCKRQRVTSGQLIAVWARALRASPRSEALRQFRRQAEHFLQAHGRKVWGSAFQADEAVTRFHRLAGVRS